MSTSAPLRIRGLTLWQPWAWCIAHATKRIENRPWKPWSGVTHVAIHAGKVFDAGSVADICQRLVIDRLPREARQTAAIVAVARIAGCITSHADVPDDQVPWFFGPFGWVLADVRPLPVPLPFARGAMGLWRLPTQIEDALARFAVDGTPPGRMAGSGPAPGASR